MLRISYVIFAALLLLMFGCAASGVADKTATQAKTPDRIVVEKSAHTMKLMSGGQVLKTYKVALGNPKGVKQQEGPRDARATAV